MIPQEHSEPVLPRLRGRVGRRTRQLVLAAVLGSLMSGVALAFIRPIEYGFAVFELVPEGNKLRLKEVPFLMHIPGRCLFDFDRTTHPLDKVRIEDVRDYVELKYVTNRPKLLRFLREGVFFLTFVDDEDELRIVEFELKATDEEVVP